VKNDFKIHQYYKILILGSYLKEWEKPMNTDGTVYQGHIKWEGKEKLYTMDII